MTSIYFRTGGFSLTALVTVVTMVGLPTACATGVGPALGEQRRWALHLRVQLEQPGKEQPIGMDLEGEWVSTITTVRPGEYDAALELVNARLHGNAAGSVPAEAIEQAQQRLARRFWATYRYDGALIGVHFFKDVNPGDRNLLQMIVTQTQLVRADRVQPVWNVMERDGAGNYLAIYNWLGSNAVVKRKLKYVDTDSAAGAPPGGIHLDVDQSELRFSLDPEGGIVVLDGRERARIGVPFGNAGQLTTITEIHLSNLRKSRAPELIGSLERARPDVVASAVVTHKANPDQVRAQLDVQLLDGHTTESLLLAARAKETEPALPDRLAALFRRHPEAIPAALEALQKDGPQKRITNALGAAGSPAAIEALGKLARDNTMVVDLRVDALTSLIGIQNPSLQSMRIALDVLDDADAGVAFSARLAGGALARAGRTEHSAEADAIDAALIAHFRKAKEVRELSELLGALGNSIGPSVLPVIEDTLRDSRDAVRAAAARGLRLAQGPEVDRLLAEVINSDQAPGVRSAAIFAATFRHPIGRLIGDALIHAAREDPVDYVRSNAVALLSHNPDASPQIAETLEWITEHDAKPGIRRLAREALGSGKTGN